MNAEMMQRSTGVQVLGTALIVMPLPGFLYGIPFDLWAAWSFAFGIALLSGLLSTPFVWWYSRRRPDLVLAPIDVVATDEGIAVKTKRYSSQQAWTVYRRARELPGAFVLETGVGAASPIAKNGVSKEAIRNFRRLLRQKGLLSTDRGQSPFRYAWRFALGAGLGVLPFLVGFAAASR